MRGCDWNVEWMVKQVEALKEPYRQNAIEWLESHSDKPLYNFEEDLSRFVDQMNPLIRDRFLFHAGLILEDAVRFFGSSQEPTVRF